MPTPSAAIFFLTSSDASSTSRRAMLLAFSATSFAAVPRPMSAPLVSASVSGVGMAPPIDDLRDHDPRGECSSDHEEGLADASASLLLLWTGTQLRPHRSRRGAATGGLVGRRLPPGARHDQAGLHLAQEGG